MFANLAYRKTGTLDANYTNITNLLRNSANLNASSVPLGYQAGLGADFTIGNSKDGSNAVILFIKGGVNQPFSRDIYKVEGQKYDAGIKKGDWMISLGFKFASRMGR